MSTSWWSLFTPRSVDRHWLWIEVGGARANACRIVPVLYHLTLDDIDKAGGATFLRAKNVVDINGLDTNLSQLKRRVRGRASRRS